MSIKKIADSVGVSPATVSRVLNNPDYHCSSPELRDKIWNTAMQMNYVPNEAASSAVEYLIELGHENIGYVGSCHNEVRYQGYLETLQANGLDVDSNFIIETKQTEMEGFEAMEKYSNSEKCPTGIYCSNDITAIGMLKYLNKHKNRYYMPSIISSDGIEEAMYTTPMLTTIQVSKEEMGKFALYLLVDRLRGGHRGKVKIELECRLMKRESCTSVDESRWCEYYI